MVDELSRLVTVTDCLSKPEVGITVQNRSMEATFKYKTKKALYNYLNQQVCIWINNKINQTDLDNKKITRLKENFQD